MKVTAKLNLDYVWRTALFGIVFTGWGLWSLYDGLVAYPRFNEEHLYSTYKDLRQQAREDAAEDISQASTAYEEREAVNQVWSQEYRPIFLDRLEETDWWQYYRSKAFTKEKAPMEELEAVQKLEEDYHSPWDLRAQYFMAAVCMPLGLLALGSLGISASKRYWADDEGLHGVGGTDIPYETIESIDWSRWKRKGIARVSATVDGQTRSFKLDDWKFKGVDDLLKAVEERRPDLARPDWAKSAEAKGEAETPQEDKRDGEDAAQNPDGEASKEASTASS